MKNRITITIVALGLALPTLSLNAQDAPRPPRGPGAGGPRPPSPLIAALDINHDGIIDADELNAAPKTLQALDKNGDGKLTPDEMRPPAEADRKEIALRLPAKGAPIDQSQKEQRTGRTADRPDRQS